MTNICSISTCILNQWALDFQGNYERILESIKISKKNGSKYRSGPELEICGYGCGDHFYEADTLLHSWEVLDKIISDEMCNDIIIDVGMPISYKGAIYNCRVICLNKKILFIRPKQNLAHKQIFRENRWFNPWIEINKIEEFTLPSFIQTLTGQRIVPIGDALLILNDVTIGIETCEEIWAHMAPNEQYFSEGAELIFNGNGSNHLLRKLNQRMSLITSATQKNGGVYVYTNLRGCDAERVYYDGGALISLNGEIVEQGQQFSLDDVEVLSAVVDLDEIRSYRNASNTNYKNKVTTRIPRINVEFSLCSEEWITKPISRTKPVRLITPAEEISLAPALWLWDHLRRSGLTGFFLALSGGIDSSAVACLVHSMCAQVYTAFHNGNEQVIKDLRRIVDNQDYNPISPEDICSRILVTCYMSTINNSEETKARASMLAEGIGSVHLHAAIDNVVSALIGVAVNCLNMMGVVNLKKGPVTSLKFKSQGGSYTENIALQNVQARVRMVLAYLLSQLYWWARGSQGGLLVLSSSNLDESLRGYLTKYDCSSGDLNPIGSICKEDLRMFIRFYQSKSEKFNTSLQGIIDSPPTAELEPLSASGELAQTDEQDMGMTYSELSEYGKLRKIHNCGPRSMFLRLSRFWQGSSLSLKEIGEKVKFFFRCYGLNRHKMTVATPAYHVESYDCDDNRFDLRPFLYRRDWFWQFRAIDTLVESMSG